MRAPGRLAVTLQRTQAGRAKHGKCTNRRKRQPNDLLFCAANQQSYHSPCLSSPQNCFEKKITDTPRKNVATPQRCYITQYLSASDSQGHLVTGKGLNQLCSTTSHEIKPHRGPRTCGFRAPALSKAWVGAPAVHRITLASLFTSVSSSEKGC